MTTYNKVSATKEFIRQMEIIEVSIKQLDSMGVHLSKMEEYDTADLAGSFPHFRHMICQTKAETQNMIYMVTTNMEYSLVMMCEYLNKMDELFKKKTIEIISMPIPFNQDDASHFTAETMKHLH